MIYCEVYKDKLPDDCLNCDFMLANHCCINHEPVFEDCCMGTRSEHCPLRSGSVMEWIDVRDRLPDFTGPVLVTVVDRKFNSDPAPEVKAATYKTKYRQFFRVTGNVTAWMPYPEVYRR